VQQRPAEQSAGLLQDAAAVERAADANLVLRRPALRRGHAAAAARSHTWRARLEVAVRHRLQRGAVDILRPGSAAVSDACAARSGGRSRGARGRHQAGEAVDVDVGEGERLAEPPQRLLRPPPQRRCRRATAAKRAAVLLQCLDLGAQDPVLLLHRREPLPQRAIILPRRGTRGRRSRLGRRWHDLRSQHGGSAPGLAALGELGGPGYPAQRDAQRPASIADQVDSLREAAGTPR
jgi:hypothetical protein